MAEKLTKAGESWHFRCAAPVREVFAVMEQMLGTPPYRFEAVAPDEGRIVEIARIGLFGQWKTTVKRPGWVSARATPSDNGTDVVVTCSRRPRNVSRGPGGVAGAPARALQMVQLLTRGTRDQRTVYRDQAIPPGPVTLVASWAGTPYQLFTEARFDAPRAREIYTASRLVAVETRGPFVRVKLADDTTGWLERDQIVSAPDVAVRSVDEARSRSTGFV